MIVMGAIGGAGHCSQYIYPHRGVYIIKCINCISEDIHTHIHTIHNTFKQMLLCVFKYTHADHRFKQ